MDSYSFPCTFNMQHSQCFGETLFGHVAPLLNPLFQQICSRFYTKNVSQGKSRPLRILVDLLSFSQSKLRRVN